MTLVLTTDSGPAGAVLDVLTPAQSTTRQRALELTTDIVRNTSTAPGATLTNALDNVAPAAAGTVPATAGLPGYVSRHIYVNAASALVGTTFLGVVIEAAPASWTTPAQIPPGNNFSVAVAPGTAGAGGGNVGQESAGTCSGGGARHEQEYTRDQLIRMLPIAFVAGLGGQGGLGMQMTGAVTNRASQPGSPGNLSSFGGRQFAYPGGRGEAGVNAIRQGGSGGGLMGAGPDGGSSSAAKIGGAPATTAGEQGTAYDGAGCLTIPSANSVGSLPSMWGGASGGNRSGNGSSPGVNGAVGGGNALWGGAGGGCGGTNGTNPGDFQNGAAGGGRYTDGAVPRGSGVAGGVGINGVGTRAGDGQKGADGNESQNGDGGSGGGSNGGNNFLSGGNTDGGVGGDGGFPSGGAGSGGNVRTQPNALATNTAGPGGKGGDGMIMVTGRL